MCESHNSLCWASLHNHSDHSLLDGLSKPEQLIRRAIENDINALALSDHGSMAGVLKFQSARKKVFSKVKGTPLEDKCKQIKLINACEMYIKVSDKENSHLVVLAKNLSGYRTLVKIVSEATRRENMWRKPRLSLEQIASYNVDKNLIAFSGHCGSDMGNVIFGDLKGAYSATSYEECKTFVHPEWRQRLYTKLDEYIQTFGRDNFWLEVQLFDSVRMPAQTIITKTLRWLSDKTGIPVVATCDSHYSEQYQAKDQRVLLCSALKTTLPKVQRKMASDDDDIALGGFFRSDKYYLPSAREMISLHNEDEIKASLDIASMCEDYDLSSKPIIPKFDCPNEMSSDEYMTHLCRNGYRDKFSHLQGDQKKLYGERIKEELNIFQPAGLSDYFLLVWDIIEWIKSQGGLVGEGRGSVGGCLTAYLMGITALDSIEHNLTRSRFYNDGRNTKDNISLPDIDIDVEPEFREKVINYLKGKHGQNRVAQIATYGRLMGRACLSEVLKVHEAVSFEEVKRCTQFIPDESSITDDLNDMKEETGESSIILWALQNNAKELKEWAYLTLDGKIEGQLGTYFEQAIRLEGTYKHRSKHAGGVVIYPYDIDNYIPMTYDKNESVIAFDLKDCETSGGVKVDVLGSDILTKIRCCALAIENEFLLEEEQ